MSDQQKAAGLQMLQQKQAGMQQPQSGVSTAPGSLAAMEGRYVAPTGAGYQYYQGGSTAPPFNPQALQAQLQQALAPPPQQVPRQGQPMQNGITYGPRSAGMAQYGLFPNGVPIYPRDWRYGSGGVGGPGGGGVGGGGFGGGSS